ncbi:hypothetical protein CBI38_15230 [Rhodococcus oxybenzonivorans]|uniref:Uncharacterized protein n=1 Tax=Rhodococcus oxybenzonivorans TaxID=1990687 RepID=A0A2S2BVX9_9NOCA|nr:hypothetical protein CBI38_15230 [Rhodococcus oxybenzonivorans]
MLAALLCMSFGRRDRPLEARSTPYFEETQMQTPSGKHTHWPGISTFWLGETVLGPDPGEAGLAEAIPAAPVSEIASAARAATVARAVVVRLMLLLDCRRPVCRY